MKIQELLNQATLELEEELKTKTKEMLKERLREIKALKICLNKAEKQLESFLEKDISDVELMQ